MKLLVGAYFHKKNNPVNVVQLRKIYAGHNLTLAPVLEKGSRRMHSNTPFLLLMTCHTPEAKKITKITKRLKILKFTTKIFM
jgi:hypothetical protein